MAPEALSSRAYVGERQRQDRLGSVVVSRHRPILCDRTSEMKIQLAPNT